MAKRCITRSEARAQEIRSITLAAVGFYQTEYLKAHIEPPGARWRELRFSFPRYASQSAFGVTADDLWEDLYVLIDKGVIKEYQTINYPRYVIDYPALRAYEKKWKWNVDVSPTHTVLYMRQR